MNITPQASTAQVSECDVLLSVQAYDVYRKTPIHDLLRVFSVLYCAASLFRRTLKALWLRKHNIADDAAIAVN